MQVLKWLLIAALGLAALTLLAAQFGAFSGRAPGHMGARDGRLKPPSKTPNSVSSQADMWVQHPMQDYARIAPLALKGDGPATIAQIKRIAETMPGAKVVESRPDYLYVQFSTRLMKFVDDAEFWFDPASGLVQVRSASRLGRKDFGVNRSRIEAIRQALAAS
ncbi:MAG TPA: DUF1499 domain-containing protein [Rubrivivax sp.]|jgi:uncharacterized protein (DUF1499 family)|nr:DUF1499 domain-containing protein [Rubrivivax sp.]